jgi:plastocyanin
MRVRSWALAVTSVAAAAITLPATAAAATKTVWEGAPPTAPKLLQTVAQANDFFLHKVTINAGDTVNFQVSGFHNVDLPGASGKDTPFLLTGPTVTGVKDFAGNPFWFNGHVPSLSINPLLLHAGSSRTYNGTSRVYSGLPLGSGPPPAFKVTFTKPGTYKYFCDVHAGMIGYVVVKAHGTPIPSARQDAAAVASQVATDVTTARKLSRSKVGANKVYLGEAGSGGVEVYTMFPSKLHVKVGTVVTFLMSKPSVDVHTATFGPKAYLMSLANSITSPTPLQQVWYASDPGTIAFGRTSHGNGFANTGILDEDPTTPFGASGKIRFTTKGTYRYICLIHPFMRGTIIVK